MEYKKLLADFAAKYEIKDFEPADGARLGASGDLVTVMSFIQMTPQEAQAWKPKAILLSNDNSKSEII